MRVYNRKDFLKLPAGTVYCPGKEWYFEGIQIKADSLENDWIYLDPSWSNGFNSGDCFDILADSLETGSSFDMSDAFGRDGGFDDDQIFLVYEKEDLIKLRSYIDEGINNA